MNITVLAGGISTERDVSLTSGKNVVKALRSKGHNAVLLDLFLGYEAEDYQQFFTETAQEAEASISAAEPRIEEIRRARAAHTGTLFGTNVLNICKASDFVFLALHGEDGENGKVQATFDLLGIRYTGTGCLGSAMAMNKHVSKQIMQANAIPNAAYHYLHKGDALPALPVPCVIKPASGGSSVGVSIVLQEADIAAAVENAFQYENEILVEQYIQGREFSVGVLGDTVLPPIEIIPKDGFYDYENKYQPGKTEEICPAVLTAEQTQRVQALTAQTFAALELEVYGRIDFILSEADGEFYALEANSLPGLTQLSLLPQEAAAIGIDFPSLCCEILRLSEKKYENM